MERWRSQCSTKIELLSVRACDHPDSPGRCARGDHPIHTAAGVWTCHGRGCPLVAVASAARSDGPARAADPDHGLAVAPPPELVRLLPPPDLSDPNYAAAVYATRDELRGPEVPRPAGWLASPITHAAHRLLADEVTADPGPCPPCAGRGVIIVGGGRYEAGIYVAVRMLRHVGCALPVQVWHRGADEPVGLAVRSLPGVEVCDLRADPRTVRAHRRVDGGWQAKLDAVIACGWREVIYLDADAYPVADPTPCFDHTGPGGCLYWPDSGTDNWIRWDSYGLSPEGRPPAVQGGHCVYDVVRAWPLIALAHHYDHHSEYYYQQPAGVGGYGDQDQIRAAIHRLGHPVVMATQDAGLRRGVFVQAGPTGRPLWVHRCGAKFGRPGDFGRAAKRRLDLPLETVAWGFFGEWLRAVDRTAGIEHAAV